LCVGATQEIGASFQLLIEPKPREPMKHQYDYDVQTVMAFLKEYGLERHFKVNVEPNHTTLAGHDFVHDILVASK
jgi:xylose isomerase